MALENREAEGDETSQNLVKVELMADYTLLNDGSLEKLHPQIDQLLSKLLKEIHGRVGTSISWTSRKLLPRDRIA